jgi:hypothetical protein
VNFAALPDGTAIRMTPSNPAVRTVVYIKNNPTAYAQWRGTDGSFCSDTLLIGLVERGDTATVLTPATEDIAILTDPAAQPDSVNSHQFARACSLLRLYGNAVREEDTAAAIHLGRTLASLAAKGSATLPVHPRATDQWCQEDTGVPNLAVAVDESGCIVLHTPGGTYTISNVDSLSGALLDARGARHKILEG